jgi:hypothetical protein
LTLTSKVSEVKHLSYWERLKALNVMSLQRRRERFTILQIYKIFKGLTPNDLQLEFTDSARRGPCCKIPPLAKSCSSRSQTILDASFRVRGARLWNRIPTVIRCKPTLSSFKSALTRYLLLLQDCPPVPGISSRNSLIDVLSGEKMLETVEDDGGREEETR